MTYPRKDMLLPYFDCAQIVPAKLKFSQIFPKISKTAVKISCIINMLKLCSFCAK
jgi:hypothetical protein